MAAAGGVTHSLAAYIPFESVGVQADSSQLTYIVDEAIKALAMIQSAFLFTYGAKEIFFDSRQFQEKVWGGRLCAVSQAIFGIFGDNETSAHDYYLIHGTLFLTSGAYFALSSLHCYQCLDLYGCLDELHLAAETLFVAANIVALKFNMQLYMHAKSSHAENAAILRSCVIGIVSNLFYILAEATRLFGFSTALALVFGCIAVSTGGVKIIYDFFYANTFLNQ